jgi:hypothetical protein
MLKNGGMGVDERGVSEIHNGSTIASGFGGVGFISSAPGRETLSAPSVRRSSSHWR